MTTNSSFAAQSKDFIIVLSVAVGITSILSIIGSVTIILSYIFFKELRTASRFLLLNLSLATLIVGLSNLLGAITSYKFIGRNETVTGLYDQPLGPLCYVEAFTGVYASDSAILWTIALLVYLYISLALYRPTAKWDNIISIICMVVCWGIPLPIMIAYFAEGYFGFVPEYSPGFCTIAYSRNGSNYSNLYRIIIGYDMFVFLSFIVLPILSIVFLCHTKPKMKSFDKYFRLAERISVIKAAEKKLLFVPIAFMVIKIWSLINGIVIFYLPDDISNSYRGNIISAIFVFLAGVGDSAQGLINAIFFCLLTPAVRIRIVFGFYKFLYCYCCSQYCSSTSDGETTILVPSSPNTERGSNNINNSDNTNVLMTDVSSDPCGIHQLYGSYNSNIISTDYRIK